MAIKTQEELINQFNAIVGDENTDDNVLTFLTDMRDTLANSGSERIHELEQQITTIDTDWRKRYKQAFMGEVEPIQDDTIDDKPRTFDDLFDIK